MFIPVVTAAVGRDVMRVALPSGIVLDVPMGSDPKWIAQILGGIETK
jgi:hypothetical protein